jgi:hypothetical protein
MISNIVVGLEVIQQHTYSFLEFASTLYILLENKNMKKSFFLAHALTMLQSLQ